MELCILLSRQERAFCSAGSVNLGLILEKGRCRGENRAAHGDRQLHVRRFLCGIGGTQNAAMDYGSASCSRISRMLQNARVVLVWSRRAVKRLPTSTDRRVCISFSSFVLHLLSPWPGKTVTVPNLNSAKRLF
eukprot:c24374_g1_i2 orf=132-530(-)